MNPWRALRFSVDKARKSLFYLGFTIRMILGRSPARHDAAPDSAPESANPRESPGQRRSDSRQRRGPAHAVGKDQSRFQSRLVVVEIEARIVQTGDGRNEAQSQSRARRIAALFQPHETF